MRTFHLNEEYQVPREDNQNFVLVVEALNYGVPVIIGESMYKQFDHEVCRAYLSPKEGEVYLPKVGWYELYDASKWKMKEKDKFLIIHSLNIIKEHLLMGKPYKEHVFSHELEFFAKERRTMERSSQIMAKIKEDKRKEEEE